MQGYILSIQPQKNEDLIVKILTQRCVLTLYRFYGARHSIVHLGHKIDFEKELNGTFMPKLRNIIHLGFSWERDLSRVYVWQRFIEILHLHLKDIYELEDFYIEILDRGANKLIRQNPFRVALEMYAEILLNEGRNPISEQCFLCGEDLGGERIGLLRGFLFSHIRCAGATNTMNAIKTINNNLDIGAMAFDRRLIEEYLTNKTTIMMSDEEVLRAYNIVLLGL